MMMEGMQRESMEVLASQPENAPVAGSLAFLSRGSGERFVDALCGEALAHPAVHHPYLERLSEGRLPDVRSAIRDYCHQYYFYSIEFPSYLQAVIGGLQSEAHRAVVRQNLEEERGEDPRHADGEPHTEMFQRFRRAAGVSAAYDAAHPPCTTVLIWRDLFLQKCGSPQPGVGLGAIGIATELVVSTIYRYLHRAVSRHTEMTPSDYRFLTVHLDCDDEHAEQLRRISIDLAGDPGNREALRFGVISSLNLRHAFWDVMLARALQT